MIKGKKTPKKRFEMERQKEKKEKKENQKTREK